MDPRSPATPEILTQQLQLGQQIFAEAMEARRALAEIDSVRKQLADLQQKIGDKDSAIKAAVADAQTEISQIEVKPAAIPEQASGLQNAFADMASALRVVEGGDRAVPPQAIAVYNESARHVRAAIAEWSEFKATKLSRLNQKLSEANLAPIAISEIEQEVQFLMSR
jgi:seryl-tRNA synthetase